MGIVILRKQQSFRRTCYIGVGPDQTAIRQPVMRNESTGAKCRTVTYSRGIASASTDSLCKQQSFRRCGTVFQSQIKDNNSLEYLRKSQSRFIPLRFREYYDAHTHTNAHTHASMLAPSHACTHMHTVTRSYASMFRKCTFGC